MTGAEPAGGPAAEARAQRFADAYLAVIGRAGLPAATPAAAAAEAGVPADELVATLGDAADAVAALLDRAGREAARAAASGGSVRDRLFAGIMAGLDVLQAHRAAVRALVAARDPGLVALVLARLGPGLRRLAAAAGVDVSGLAGMARLAGLATVIARAGRAWLADDSADMSRTMAELDRLLAEAERVATEGLTPDAFGIRLPFRRRD